VTLLLICHYILESLLSFKKSNKSHDTIDKRRDIRNLIKSRGQTTLEELKLLKQYSKKVRVMNFYKC
jgi:hypothetical protein